MDSIVASLRLAAVTSLVTVVGYTGLVLTFATLTTPSTATGSLVRDADGRVVGSRLIGQRFEGRGYLWPRPSAVDWNASGAGGSNLSPTSAKLTERAASEVQRHGARPDHLLPADLAAASGSGLDPHITLVAARYQAPRIASARGRSLAEIEALLARHAVPPGGSVLTPSLLVNVLEANLALDDLGSPMADAGSVGEATRRAMLEGVEGSQGLEPRSAPH